jgi:spore germination protein KA
LESKAQLDSGVNEAKNEKVTRGPKDAFTENYQTNIGLIRRRIKTEDLWLEEFVLGTKSKTKVGIMYVKGIASQPLVDKIIEKVKNINIDSIPDSNYVVELISNNKNSVFANYMSTERPDRASNLLLDGRIAIVVENTQYITIIPATFLDFFQSTEDLYQKVRNVNTVRFIRLIAFLIATIGPAIYIALTTYNLEAIPQKLVINLTTQREGVPFPTVFETIMMIIVFEILRETDTRLPNAIGNSLSIVGAIVLGQAAVSAGIVSPITIIVVSATAISGMISSNMDMVQGIRWWRFILIIFAAFFGIFGVVISGLLFMISTCSIKSFGVPFMAPIFPFIKSEQQNSLFLTNKFKFRKRDSLTAEGDNTRTGGQ